MGETEAADMVIKAFPFEDRYGNRYLIAFQKSRYIHGDGIAVVAWCAPFDTTVIEDADWEPYGGITVNLGTTIPEGMAHLDTNNMPDLANLIIEKGWASRIGSMISGFYEYPLVKFSDEFIDEMCIEEGRG